MPPFATALLCAAHNLKYRRKYRHFLTRSAGCTTVFMHPPKTAGRSLAKALDLPDPGHFSFAEVMASRTAKIDRIVFATREPEDRLLSIFKMSRKPNQAKFHNPLYPLRAYASAEEFILSENFAVFVQRHYFFRPQRYFIEPALQHAGVQNKVWIRFESLAADVKDRLGVEIAHVNKSPDLGEATLSLSEKARNRLQAAYATDYELLRELDAWAKAR